MKFLYKKITLMLTTLVCVIANSGMSLASGMNTYNIERSKHILIYAIPVGIIGLIIMIMYFGRKKPDDVEDNN